MEKSNAFIERFTESLVKKKMMSSVEAESFVEEFNDRAKGNIVTFLLEEGIVEREDILKALSDVFEEVAFDVRGHFFNHELLLLFPKDFLKRYSFIPLEVNDDFLTIVISNPENEEVFEELVRYASYNVTVNVGIKSHIHDAIDEYYEEDVMTSEIEEQQNDIEDDEDDIDDSDIVDIL